MLLKSRQMFCCKFSFITFILWLVWGSPGESTKDRLYQYLLLSIQWWIFNAGSQIEHSVQLTVSHWRESNSQKTWHKMPNLFTETLETNQFLFSNFWQLFPFLFKAFQFKIGKLISIYLPNLRNFGNKLILKLEKGISYFSSRFGFLASCHGLLRVPDEWLNALFRD